LTEKECLKWFCDGVKKMTKIRFFLKSYPFYWNCNKSTSMGFANCNVSWSQYASTFFVYIFPTYLFSFSPPFNYLSTVLHQRNTYYHTTIVSKYYLCFFLSFSVDSGRCFGLTMYLRINIILARDQQFGHEDLRMTMHAIIVVCLVCICILTTNVFCFFLIPLCCMFKFSWIVSTIEKHRSYHKKYSQVILR